MAALLKQLTSTLGAVFAGACCLGISAALSVLTAVGAGFLINDAVLIPLYVALLALSLWLLYQSARAHGRLASFRVGAAGAALALVSLWISAYLVFAGLLALVLANIVDFVQARRRAA